MRWLKTVTRRTVRRPVSGRRCRHVAGFSTLFAICFSVSASEDRGGDDLWRLDLEQLMEIRVTSAAKKEQSLADTPAAIYVITAKDVARSGALNIPDLLRTVPGLHVAQIDSHQWAISARGFNGLFANKLLILIDGRTVYTPIFAGVYWDVQDTMLEDIERIEVIRGTGATLWGANAVNGVINITTREASRTHGGRVTVGGGSEDQVFGSFRYGKKVKDGLDFRVYGKAFRRDGTRRLSGRANFDEWQFAQAGFRIDHSGTADGGSSPDRFTFQGDVYEGELEQEVLVPVLMPPFETAHQMTSRTSGANVLGRWERRAANGHRLKLQAYYDRVRRHDVLFDLEQDTLDLEFQLRMKPHSRHDMVAGFGYRYVTDSARPEIVTFVPGARSYSTVTGFLQDEISLIPDRLSLVLGTKLGHNDFNGFEIQPNVRLSWALDERRSLWGSVSRSVRTSSRSEHDATADVAAFPARDGTPVTLRLFGNREQDSEKVLAAELGFRFQPSSRFWVDTVVFFNDYRKLRTFEPGLPFLDALAPSPQIVAPLVTDDQAAGESRGVEIAALASLRGGWRLRLGYAFIDLDIVGDPGSRDVTVAAIDGETPRHQVSLHFDKELPRGFNLNGTVRWIDDVPSLDVDSYAELDLRLARKLGRAELSLVGRNLLDSSHAEYVSTIINSPRAEIERSVHARLTWDF